MKPDDFERINKLCRVPGVRVTFRSGYVTYNQAVVDALGKPKAIVFLSDPNHGAVALKASSPKVKHAYPVRKYRSKDSYRVNARTFCTHHGIGDPPLRFFDENVVEGVLDGALVLDPAPATNGEARRYEFQEFTHKGSPVTATQLRVSFLKDGRIDLNRASSEVFGPVVLGEDGREKEAKRVTADYSAKTRGVWIRPTSANDRNGFKLTLLSDGCSYTFSGSRLLNQLSTRYKIKLEGSQVFRAERLEDGLIFYLDSGTPVGHGHIKNVRAHRAKPAMTQKLRQWERDAIKAVRDYGGRPSGDALAQALQTTRTTLYRKLDALGFSGDSALDRFISHALSSEGS